MNKTLAIAAITLVAVVMGMSVVTPTLADHGGLRVLCVNIGDVYDPNTDACIPSEDCPNGVDYFASPIHCLLDTDINDNHKVVLCHQPSNSNGKEITIEVSSNAVEKHLEHGDYLGKCDPSRL